MMFVEIPRTNGAAPVWVNVDAIESIVPQESASGTWRYYMRGSEDGHYMSTLSPAKLFAKLAAAGTGFYHDKGEAVAVRLAA